MLLQCCWKLWSVKSSILIPRAKERHGHIRQRIMCGSWETDNHYLGLCGLLQHVINWWFQFSSKQMWYIYEKIQVDYLLVTLRSKRSKIQTTTWLTVSGSLHCCSLHCTYSVDTLWQKWMLKVYISPFTTVKLFFRWNYRGVNYIKAQQHPGDIVSVAAALSQQTLRMGKRKKSTLSYSPDISNY